ncbi:hypothetical protein WJX81_000703 [Elliptochloris bilobata]|uniref:CBS domain-containing protein n=1 Tax=Elliptochloris bilobata TaxID=381761 RepID=A0AAW1R2F3_9CHLO
MVTVASTASVGEALQVLAEQRILSAPVLDPETRLYAGFFDCSDALRGLMSHAYPELLEAEWVGAHPRLSISHLQTLGPQFAARPVASLLHDEDLFYKADRRTSLLEVVRDGFHIRPNQEASTPEHHRIAVFRIVHGAHTPDGDTLNWEVEAVVSETDVVRLLLQHAQELGGPFSASLASLGLGQEEAAFVTADTPALAAFAALRRDQRSALGVTAAAGGPLMGNLSISDLRGLRPERWGALALPVGAFLALQHGGLAWEDALFGRLPPGMAERGWAVAPPPAPLVACEPSATLAEAAAAVSGVGVHRCYVLRHDGRAAGVVSLADMLRALTA